MIRFRNPGTQYSTQIQVMKQLYLELKDKEFFTLDDMAIVIAKSKLMTAYGYAGVDALKLSNTVQESMNSAKMNAKMYAEVFRMLGWITPSRDNASYPLSFTYIGAHIALSDGDCSHLYEQSVLGIVNPTEFSSGMSYDERVRFFKCALRTFIDLGGLMYKYELCIGPMSVNDEDDVAYGQMISKIRSLRGDYDKLKRTFLELADGLGMKPTSVDNCTRLPIAFMKNCGWVESVNDNSLYNRSLSCLKLTEHGKQVHGFVENMVDLRLDCFQEYEQVIQKALIRIGVYSMLERSGYDLGTVQDILETDINACRFILNGKELLFSPYQTIKRGLIEEALGIRHHLGEGVHHSIGSIESTAVQRQTANAYSYIDVDILDANLQKKAIQSVDTKFSIKVLQLKNDGLSNEEISRTIFDSYRNAKQETFYPLVSTLFKIMGFDCSFSRPGDHGARWDAIIRDPVRSIPIEIKSPTEEQQLSVKAVRQALENKIVLLSRRTHATLPETTTLAIGYFMPNDRAEVVGLISAIKETYGYKVAVIDLESIISVAVCIITEGRTFDKNKMFDLEGLINANIRKDNRTREPVSFKRASSP